MTFLLFLASLAVLEYLVGNGKSPARPLKTADIKPVGGKDVISAETATADLMALSQALSGPGRVAAPQTEKAPQEVSHGG